MSLRVWVVVYNPASFTEDLYHRGLPLVDPESCARIKKFFRREDACRCLIGRLLPRMLLQQRGVNLEHMSFAVTEAGKPYVTTPGIDPPIGFNVSHDNALVAMAFAPGCHGPPAFRIGIDVMKVRLPGRETFAEFVETVGDSLTLLERRIIFEVSQDEGLRRFFWMWTMKEAYTKALGLGLGFDFSRVEYNVPENVLTVDGQAPQGWQFRKFEFHQGEEFYLGVAAEFVDGDQTTFVDQPSEHWLEQYDAVSFILDAIEKLG